MNRELLEDTIRDELKIRISEAVNKQFKLLYKASQDGCSVEDFQKTCLDKGPTLTVLYGRDGSVFGGYTSKSWSNTQKNLIYDRNAFMFYCCHGGSTKFLEMDERDYHRAIACYSEWGPTFGGGFFRGCDLRVFKRQTGSKIEKNGEYFELNGKINLNSIYKSKEAGFVKTSINGGGLTVKDIEVYKVEDLDFFEDTSDKWLTSISSLCSNQHVQHYNILLTGLVTAGKTSFCRTLEIACTKKLQKAFSPIAHQGRSVTNKVVEHILTLPDTCKVRLLDIRGFASDRDYKYELVDLLDGRIKDEYEFPDKSKQLDSRSMAIDDINPDKIVHAVCIVIDATKSEVQSTETYDHVYWIRKMAHDRGIHVSILASFMDIICDVVHKSPKNITRSVRAQNVLKKMNEKYGVELYNIYPIINYTNDTCINEAKSMLALRALENMVEGANTFVTGNIGRLKRRYIQTCQKIVEKKGLNILCVGRVNVGKSFFIDTIMSTFEKGRSKIASGGLQRDADNSNEPTTKQLNRHTLRITDDRRECKATEVHFLDMPGFSSKNVIDFGQIKSIVEGHCPGGDFSLLNRIDETVDGYIHEPKWENRVHGVCFILDNKSFKEPNQEKELIRDLISKLLTPKVIPYIVVVTKMDTFDKKRDDIIRDTTERFGFTAGNIHVVKNYVNEAQVSDTVEIPIIGCVQAILEKGCEYYRKKSTNFDSA